MPSPFHGIEIASRALRAFQRGLDVAGHNIANVNSRGYTRQTVEYGPTEPMNVYHARLLSLGTGVGITSINRIQDGFLQLRTWSSNGGLGRFEALASQLRQVEGVFHEAGGGGIADALDRFFNAWSGLASNPGSDAARMEVQMAGRTLVGRVRGAYQDLMRIETQIAGQVAATFDRIDTLTAKIAELNTRIQQQVGTGAQPNDLLDQRDLAVADLSRLVDVQSYAHANGSVSLYMGSLPLVDASGSRPIPRTYDASTFTLDAGTAQHKVRAGQLYGLFEAANSVDAYQAQLDALADNLRTEINLLHRTGINPNAATDIPFFRDPTGPGVSAALDFELSAEVLADIKNIASGVSGNAGDGALALAIGQLRDQSLAALGNRSFSGFFATLAASVGRDVSSTGESLKTQEAVANQIEAQRQSVGGVSIDDEMASMLRFQRSYQAAARALALFDEVTEDLISLIR